MLDEAREQKGQGANVFAYTSAISACGKAGQWEKAVSLLDVSIAAQTGGRRGEGEVAVVVNAWTIKIDSLVLFGLMERRVDGRRLPAWWV